MTLDRLLRRPVLFLSSWILRCLGLLLLGLACAGTVQAQLLVTRLTDAPDPVVARSTVTYTIGIADQQGVARSGITLNVTIPAGVIYDSIEGLPASASCSGITPGTSTGAAAKTLSCLNISIPASQQDSIYTLKLRPQVSGALTVTAAIVGVAQNQEQNTTVNVGADLGLTIKPLADAAYGTSQTVEFAIQNYGPNDSPSSTLTYNVPSGFDIKATAVPSGCSLLNQVMTCSLGAIAVGADKKQTLKVTGTIVVSNSSAMTHSADIAASGGVSDGVSENNTAYRSMNVQPGSLLSVVKSQSITSRPIRLNEEFSYQFDPKYTGSYPESAKITDTLPANICFDSSKQPTTYTSGGWSCTVSGNVCPAVGAVLSCTRTGTGVAGNNVSLGLVTVPVKGVLATTGLGVTNTVSFTATGPGTVTPATSSVLTVVTGTGADLSARKTQNRSPQVAVPVCTNPPCSGLEYEIAYSISASNLGPDDVLASETVRMVDNVPGGVYVKSISSQGNVAVNPDAFWDCRAQVSETNSTPLTLPGAGPFALVCTSRGKKAIPANGLSDVVALYTNATKASETPLLNNLCVSLPNAPGKDPNSINNCADVGVLPQGTDTQADVALVKRVRGPGDKPDNRQLAGLPVVWEIEVINLGPNVARDVVITDSISNVAVDRPYSTSLVLGPDSGVVMNNCALTKGSNYLTLTNCSVTTLPVCKPSTDTSGSTAPPCPRVQISVVHAGDDATGNDFTRTNSASIQTTGTADKVLSNNSSGTVTAYLTGRTDLQVIKTGNPAAVAAGQLLNYTITAKNLATSPGTARNVMVTDTLPSGVVFLSATPSGTGSCTAPPKGTAATSGNNTVRCSWASMARNTQQTITIQVRPQVALSTLVGGPGAITNTVEIASDTLEVNTADNRATLTTQILNPVYDLLVNKNDDVDPVDGGDEVTYTLKVTNNGASTAERVVLKDFLPSDAGAPTYVGIVEKPSDVSCTTQGVSVGVAGGTVTCTIPVLPGAGAGATGEGDNFKILKIKLRGSAKGTFPNRAKVAFEESRLNAADQPQTNNEITEFTSVRLKADVEVVSKVAVQTGTSDALPVISSSMATQGFDWLVRLRNNGPSDAETTTFSDTLPTGMVLTGTPTFTVTNGSFTPAAPSCTGAAGGTAVSCAIAVMPANGTATVRIPVKMSSAPAAGTTITNRASLVTTGSNDTQGGTDTNKPNNYRDGTTTVQGAVVSGYVFYDLNGNGKKEDGEPGIATALTLKNTATNAVVGTTTSDAATGAWSFAVVPGTYTVTETQPALYAAGLTTVGTVGGTSSGTVAGGNRGNEIQAIVVPAGGASINNLFGEERPSITVRVFEDPSNDGIPAATGEPGIGGVVLKLTGTDADGQAVNLTAAAVPGKTGHYIFTNVPVSDGTGYTITETQPALYLPGKASVQSGLTGSAQAGGNVITGVKVPAGSLQLGEYWFGEILRPNATVTVRVYEDLDDNGIPAATGEAGIGGVSLRLSGTDAQGKAVDLLATAVSGQTGRYSFANVPPSNGSGYTITETQPTGYLPGKANANGLAGTVQAGGNVITGVTVNTGNTAVTSQGDYWFGELRSTDLQVSSKVAVATGTETSKTSVLPQEPFDYLVTVQNNGPQAATAVQFSDTLPSGMVLTGVPEFKVTAGTVTLQTPLAPCTGAANGTSVGCAITSMSAGAKATVRIPVQLTGNPDVGTVFTNTASIVTTGITDSNGGTDPLGGNNYNRGSVTVSPRADVQVVSKTAVLTGTSVAKTQLQSGEGFDFLVLVRNNGPQAAQTVQFTDTLPTGLELAGAPVFTITGGAFTPAAPTCTGTTGGTAVGCAIAEMPANGTATVRIPVRIKGTLVSGQVLTNTASIVTTGTTDTNGGTDTLGGNNFGRGSITYRANLSADVQVLDKTAVATGKDAATGKLTGVEPNQSFDWLVRVKNAGPDAAQTVTVTDTLPAGMVLTGVPVFTVTNGTFTLPSPVCTASGGNAVSCAITSMPLNGEGTLRMPVKITDASLVGTTVSNTATIAATGSSDTNPGNNAGTGTIPVQGSAVSGFVYHDANGNGQKDPGEAGIAGVVLTLNGTRQGGGAVAQQTFTTTASGAWSFAVPAGTYTVAETQPALYANGLTAVGTVSGTASGTVSGGTRGNTIQSIVVPANGSSINNLFGEELSTITVRVFEDPNNDGIPAATGEAGIAGVTLALTGMDAEGKAVNLPATAVTGKPGYYVFTGVPVSNPAGYTITETQPSAYLPGKASVQAGQPGSAQANGNSITGVAVTAGTLQLGDYYFGELLPTNASVTVRVFEDKDDDGVLDTGEPGIGSVVLRLTGTSATGTAVDIAATAVAGNVGSYVFANVPPSNAAGYTITETQPAAYLPGKSSVNGQPGTAQAGGNVIGSVTVATGVATQGDYLFGELRRPGTTVTARVFEDKDDDGVPDTGEPGIGSVALRLTGTNLYGEPVDISATAVAGNVGSYVFANVPPSNAAGYTITETQPAAYLPGKSSVNGQPGTAQAGGNVIGSVTVATGVATQGDYLFGELRRPGTTVTARVFEDKDDDGALDTGEPGIGSVALRLTGTNLYGEPVDISATAVAGNVGSYVFANVPPSNAAGYTITETQPAAYLPGKSSVNGQPGTAQAGGNVIGSVTVATGVATQGDYLFGELRRPGTTVTARVFEDKDDDGVPDTGEPGIGSVALRLTGTNLYGEAVDIAATAVAGNVGSYVFANVPPSNAAGYTITETQPAAYLPGKSSVNGQPGTAQAGGNVIGSVTVATGVATQGDYLFGELRRPGTTVTARVFEDKDDDGVLDTGEPGIGSVALRLTGTNLYGEAVDIAATAVAGNVGSYVFANVPPSNAAGYTITETQPAAYLPGKSSVNGQPGTAQAGGNVIGSVTVATGVATQGDYLFGELRRAGATVTARVFEDKDDDGALDAGEAGIGSVALRLTGTNLYGEAVDIAATAVAGDLGRYSFANVPPSNATGYTITETQPALYLPGKAGNNGLPGAAQAGGNLITGVTLNNGGTTVTTQGDYLFGEVVRPSATVTVRVFEDANNDGQPAAGDAGIAGVALTLTGKDAKGNAVSLTATPVAGKAGYYSFASVPPSDATGYTITETQPAQYLPGKAHVNGQPGAAQAGGNVISGVTVNTGATVVTALGDYWFGEIKRPNASITLKVFEDLNDDGAPGANESGIAGVTLTLTGKDHQGNPVSIVATPVAGTPGSYTFANVPPSDATGYTITETQPAQYLPGKSGVNGQPGTAQAGGNVITGVLVNTGSTAVTTLGDYHFGEVVRPNATVTVRVFEDANNDGQPAAGDAGIAGVVLTLTGKDLKGNPVSIAATPVAGTPGSYSFANVPPSDATGYTITETQPALYLPGKASVNGQPGAAQADGNVITGVAVNTGAAAVTKLGDYYFGEVVRPNATVTVRVFEDANDDGLPAAEDAGITGVALTLTGKDFKGNAVSLTATPVAGKAGYYSFASVPPSDATGYTITETQPALYLPGKANVNAQPGTAQAGGNVISGVTVNTGATVVTALGDYWFGEIKRPNASITLKVFEDLNDDGIPGANESGIAGVTLTLTGKDHQGNPVSIVATPVSGVPGSYTFADVPPSDATGYTITETQPVTFLPGKSGVNGQPGTAQSGGNVITGVLVNTGSTAVTKLGDYHFGEKRIERSTLSGRVWRDSNHDRKYDANEPVMAGWTVQLVACSDGGTSCTSTGAVVKASAATAADGTYRLTDIPPGKYQLRFLNPAGVIVGGVWPTDPTLNTGANAPKPGMAWIDLDQGLPVEVVNQDLPLDPGGVVYDSRTANPVAGASVRISGPAGFNPGQHLLAGTDTVVTDGTGIYQFFFLPSAPAGTYTLSVTPPADYRNSGDFPAQDGALNMANCTSAKGEVLDANTLTPCAVSSQQLPTLPPPKYFLSLAYPGVGAQAVVNNHIPLDPLVLSNTLIVLNKSTPKLTVKKGEPVPYSISARYTGPVALGSVTLVDTLPPGFKYLEGSLTVQTLPNGPVLPARAVVQGRQLQLQDQGFAVGETKKIQMVLAVGVGVSEGEYVNSVVARRGSTDVSNTATAAVRVVPDALLDCTDVIGKVYDDRNANGVQDDGEPGVPNVRIATVNGLLVNTDAEGRYHIACVAVPKEGTGSNLVLKLDERTLPSGYRVTSENPASERITRGKAVKVNFGATVHRVVRLALQPVAFADGASTLKSEHEARLAQVIEALEARPSIVRVAYEAAAGEDAALGEARVAAVREALLERWKAHCRAKGLALFNLDVEVERVPASTTPSRR